MPPHCRGCALRHGDLCRAIRGALDASVGPPHLRRYARDEPLELSGRSAGLAAIVRRGYLREERISLDGRRSLLGLSLPGDLVGQWPGMSGGSDLEAASDVELCVVTAPLLRRLVDRDMAFRTLLLRAIGRQHARQLDLVWQRGALTSRERVVAFLVNAVDTMPTEHVADGSAVVKVEIARRDWADLANTTVETISRTLTALASEGLIEALSNRRFRIRDLSRLSRLAGLEGPRSSERGA